VPYLLPIKIFKYSVRGRGGVERCGDCDVVFWGHICPRGSEVDGMCLWGSGLTRRGVSLLNSRGLVL